MFDLLLHRFFWPYLLDFTSHNDDVGSWRCVSFKNSFVKSREGTKPGGEWTWSVLALFITSILSCIPQMRFLEISHESWLQGAGSLPHMCSRYCMVPQVHVVVGSVSKYKYMQAPRNRRSAHGCHTTRSGATAKASCRSRAMRVHIHMPYATHTDTRYKNDLPAKSRNGVWGGIFLRDVRPSSKTWSLANESSRKRHRKRWDV